MKPTALRDVRRELQKLDFSHGLTRDDLLRLMPHLPHEVYLELPASKRFRNADEIVHDAVNSGYRSEGEVVPEDFDLFGSHGAESDGGPSAWGDDPIVGTHRDER